jgi:hypothetical protein
MRAAPAVIYQRVRVSAWQCVTPAGDAAASWRACRDGLGALRRLPGIGWCGPIGALPGAFTLDELAWRAAAGPWSAIAALDGLPVVACAASKGDQQAVSRFLAGRSDGCQQAGPEAATMALARRLGIRQLIPVPVAAACSTGIYALLEAADLLEASSAGHALVGASDACLTPLMLAGFAALGVLCGDAEPGTGHGFAAAEGAGFAALSDAGPWRLVAGVRLGDASHETRFTDPRTLQCCLAALWDALPDPDLIVVHGTGTAAGDAYEQAGLDAGPWRMAERLRCKPVIGHSLGASGMTELALALEAPVQRIWKLSLGFGGHLAAVALSR